MMKGHQKKGSNLLLLKNRRVSGVGLFEIR